MNLILFFLSLFLITVNAVPTITNPLLEHQLSNEYNIDFDTEDGFGYISKEQFSLPPSTSNALNTPPTKSIKLSNFKLPPPPKQLSKVQKHTPLFKQSTVKSLEPLQNYLDQLNSTIHLTLKSTNKTLLTEIYDTQRNIIYAIEQAEKEFATMIEVRECDQSVWNGYLVNGIDMGKRKSGYLMGVALDSRDAYFAGLGMIKRMMGRMRSLFEECSMNSDCFL